MKYRQKLLLAGLCAISSVASAADRKPNIVLIMADDVSWEAFGCYGAEDYKTPNLDTLAAKGIRFEHCYSTPICTTSRVQIMTGQYNFRNYTHFGYLNPKDKTFGNMMQDAGYKTAIAGKWQLNGLYNQLEGHDDQTRPHQAGFDEYCLWQLTKLKKEAGERFWSPMLEQNGKILSLEDNAGQYGPDIMSDFLCDFIERHKNEPFFVYYPSVLVHDPFVPTPDTIGDAPRDGSANRVVKDKAQKKARFVAMVSYLDKLVGKIVKKVEEVGQLDNTIIIFTSDNGTNIKIKSRWNGQEIRGGKGGLKDMGTHVPLIAYWKGHTPEGNVSSDLVDFTDFYPTLAALAQVKMGKDDPIDGRSFLPQLNGEKGNPRDWVFCHYQPYWGKTPGQFARTEDYKLYRDGRFYEVPKDLKEKNDLSKGGSGERAETVRNKLQNFLDTCPEAPVEKAGQNAKKRPIYPDWKDLTD